MQGAMTTSDPTDARLAAQYEAFPYPARDPREESRRLIIGSPSHIREIDHWVFGARRAASRPLRALMAGGGSGDGTIMLAQQMTTLGRPGQVTWLDRSAEAMRLVQARAAVRGLANIAFEQASLLDLPGSGLGPFDYIDCCGVLHHLPDPAEGLAALTSVLAPGGGIGLMVYAPHGRTGVYMLQDALRLLAPAEEAPAARVETGKRLWKQLPETAWLRRNPWITDHLKGGDAGFYDLLLNPRDVAYTVPQLAALVAGAGLRIVTLLEPLRYEPESYVSDPRLRARAAALDPIARAALAEAIAGNMGIHIAYCVRAEDPPLAPDWTDDAAIPVLREMEGAALAKLIRRDGMLPVSFDDITVPLPLPRLAAAFLPRIDARRCWGEITEAVIAGGAARDQAMRDRLALSFALERMGRLLLAAPG